MNLSAMLFLTHIRESIYIDQMRGLPVVIANDRPPHF